MINSSSPKVINLKDKLSLITDHWAPRVIAEMNNSQFKLAKLKGEFVWHQHDETDEVFFVVSGQLTILLPDEKEVQLLEGEMTVIPKGVQHKPIAIEECHVMIIEARGVTNTGDALDLNLKADNDVWI